MNQLEWVQLVKTNLPKMKWALDKYFGEVLYGTIMENLENNPGKVMSVLNEIWFLLPDHIFNIRGNPPGWPEFLEMIEAEVKV